jgi:hypothetical protein
MFQPSNQIRTGLQNAGGKLEHDVHRFSMIGRDPGHPIWPVYLSLQKPYIVNAKGKLAGDVQFGKSGREFRDAMRSGQYDGAIMKNTRDEGTIYFALYPHQIKSAIANRSFGSSDDITETRDENEL